MRPGDDKVSVIIIFYNEALSTLLRNVIAVINRTPKALLGEILLVDDGSTLDELKHGLQPHLDRLTAALPAGLVRFVTRSEHSGIVGARIRGAREATHGIILFLDSHAEPADGWMEPLVARIHEDRAAASTLFWTHFSLFLFSSFFFYLDLLLRYATPHAPY